MPNFRRFLPRRQVLWCGGVAAVLLGVAMAHPYLRQSLFGPTIRGEPWCVWENAVRRQFGEPRERMLDPILHWLGVKHPQMNLEELFDHPEMKPLVVALLDDSDPEVRRVCADAIIWFPCLRDASAVPALRRMAAERDAEDFLRASHAVWLIEKDDGVLRSIVAILEHEDPEIRALAMQHAAQIAANAPALYPQIAARAKDANYRVRAHVMYAMAHFGKQGVPELIAGMSDDNETVRYAAVVIAKTIGPPASAAIPTLEKVQTDSDTGVAMEAALALRTIVPTRLSPKKSGRNGE